MQAEPSWEVAPLPFEDGMAVVDLHSHTYFSGDSSTLIDEYVEAFTNSKLTHIAITDHQSIEAYRLLKERLGPRVICGQEQRVKEGEIIGLFLQEKIPAGLSLEQGSYHIRQQGGLVYLCHPMDESRASFDYRSFEYALEASLVDAIEYCNSKSPKIDKRVKDLASYYHVPLLGGSDAHVPEAIGSSGTVMNWFDSAASFLSSSQSATAFGRHFDPPRKWRPRIIPTT